MPLNELLNKHNLTQEDFELIKKYDKRFNSDYNKLYEFIKMKFGESVSGDLYYFLLEMRNEEKLNQEKSFSDSIKIQKENKSFFSKENLPSLLIKIGIIILLFIALSKLPYGYYTFLRIAVTAASAYLAFLYYEEGKKIFTYIFSVVAVLFNPLIPIYLSRSSWNFIDVLVAGFYLFSIFKRER